MDDKALILFDGVCNLCNGAVQFIIKRDKNEYFQFAPLQSDHARKIIEKSRLDELKKEDLKSLILVENGQVYHRSTAVLRISRHLSGGWKLCSLFLIIPRFLRDGLYDFAARHRYRWFGKKSECMVPDPSLKTRFID